MLFPSPWQRQAKDINLSVHNLKPNAFSTGTDFNSPRAKAFARESASAFQAAATAASLWDTRLCIKISASLSRFIGGNSSAAEASFSAINMFGKLASEFPKSSRLQGGLSGGHLSFFEKRRVKVSQASKPACFLAGYRLDEQAWKPAIRSAVQPFQVI